MIDCLFVSVCAVRVLIEIFQWIDCTDEWAALTLARADSFDARRTALEPVYGADTCARLGAFYRTIAQLFAGGNLGGVRVVAQKV